MAKNRLRYRAAEYGHIDCPNCGECDDRHLGENRCGLCECRFAIVSYSTKAKWLVVSGILTRVDVGGEKL